MLLKGCCFDSAFNTVTVLAVYVPVGWKNYARLGKVSERTFFQPKNSCFDTACTSNMSLYKRGSLKHQEI